MGTKGSLLAALLTLLVGASLVQAGGVVSVGLGFGGPGYHHGYDHGYHHGYHYGPGYYGCYGPSYYYPPYPVYYANPAPVIVGSVPVAVAQQPVYQAPAPTPVVTAAPTTPVVARSVSAEEPSANVDYYLDQLRNQNERVRAEAAMQLGRMKARRAIEPLTQALGSDKSPSVRDAAARGLGLIGDASALNALQRAAQADDDRDVRNSASFGAEILRSNLRGR